MLRLRRSVFTEDPIMMHTMKHEKTSPNGQALADVDESRIGVHRNTKMYMIDSNID